MKLIEINEEELAALRRVAAVATRGGDELREALATLDIASAGPPYGVWVIPAAGETNWPGGRWAERSTGSWWTFNTIAAAEDFAENARKVSRAHWRYEVRPFKTALIAAFNGTATP